MKKTLLRVIRHRDFVRKNTQTLVNKLQERALLHDISKLQDKEFDGFVELDVERENWELGSKEYENISKTNKAIALHHSRNAHHPEYHKELEDMSLLDLVEMVIDWKSAAETYSNDSQKSLEYGLSKHKWSEKHEWLIRLIAKEL
jgi:hypothetical protein